MAQLAQDELRRRHIRDAVPSILHEASLRQRPNRLRHVGWNMRPVGLALQHRSQRFADVVVRNWGGLIALMGAMLIFAARKPAVRPLALTVAGASKAIFIALVLSHGGRFLSHQAGIAVIVDLAWVVVFAAYLLAVRRIPSPDPIGTRIRTV